MLSLSGLAITKTSEPVKGEKATIEIGPLPKGYGQTLGNSLRRVLLRSLGGAAITSVRINNLDHEFTTIPGVKQNALDLVLKLKNIRVLISSDEENVVITLSKKGKGVVKAGDFNLPSGVKILNPDYEIVEVTDASATLTMEAIVEKGTGYKKADENLRDDIGRIPLDAMFEPVQLVSFTVLPSRKGAQTDLDKIVMEIVTNGTITPEDAVNKSIEVLKDFFTVLYMVTKGEEVVETKPQTDMNSWEIVKLGMSETVTEKLTTSKVLTLGDAISHSKEYYKEELGMKAKEIKELQELLAQYNLSFPKNAKKSKKA